MDDLSVHMWLAGPLPEGTADILKRLRRTSGVDHVAVMPDVHLATEFCVGTVVASRKWLFPHAVGGDIGCGMLAMRFAGGSSRPLEGEAAARILGALHSACPARRHHRKCAPPIPPELTQGALSDTQLHAAAGSEDFRLQLGTLGAGNHFLELQRENATGDLWIMIHTGSRHFGQQIFHHHFARARRLASGVMAIDAESDAGRAYLLDIQIAREYARQNRRLLADAAAKILERFLGIPPDLATLIECDHNHVQVERHGEMGRTSEFFVHRKGASPAAEGQEGLIPGSMGTHSFHTLGRGNQRSLCSSSHGAGRALSRSQARGRISRSEFRRQVRHVFYDGRMESQLLEEAPAAYKNVDAVMRAQADLTRIVRRLSPILIYKGI